MIHSSDEMRRMQIRQMLLLLGIFTLTFGVAAIFWLRGGSTNVPTSEVIKFELPSDKIDPNVLRIQNLEAQLSINELEKNELKNTLTHALKQIENNQELFSQQLARQSDQLISQINQKFVEERENLKKEIEQTSFEQVPELTIQEDTISTDTSEKVASNMWQNDPFRPRQYLNVQENTVPYGEITKKIPRGLIVVDCPQEAKSIKKWLQDSIPMGLSVKAILLSGVDAVCGVYSRSEPVPVKLQLLEEGKLPNHLRSKVKRAVILASAYGDISSERVIMRLERLRLTNLDGSYYDTAISGFVTGEDGKYGVRGAVVDRSAKMIKNAATSGALQEVSNIAQASINKPNISISSLSSAPQVVGGGVVGGSSRAFEMLADYYIKRAEHVQPVLQVDAGRIIDVTFSFSVDVGDLDVQDKIAEVRECSRMEG